MDAEALARAILTPDAPPPITGDYAALEARVWTIEYKMGPRNIYGTALMFNTTALSLARMVHDGRRRHGLIKHIRDERRHVRRMYR